MGARQCKGYSRKEAETVETALGDIELSPEGRCVGRGKSTQLLDHPGVS